MRDGIRCMSTRGGTCKGAFVLAADFPANAPSVGRALSSILGSPAQLQLDGIACPRETAGMAADAAHHAA